MRTYRWGWEDNSWPHFSVEVPDGSELALATTEYEAATNGAVVAMPHATVRVVTVRLVFIDPQEDSPESARTRHPSYTALKLIEKETP